MDTIRERLAREQKRVSRMLASLENPKAAVRLFLKRALYGGNIHLDGRMLTYSPKVTGASGVTFEGEIGKQYVPWSGIEDIRNV